MNVYIVGGNAGGYGKLFKSLGFQYSHIEEANVVVFTGGEDVSPSLYGDKKHPTTYNSEYRDNKEASIFNKALFLKIPMVGICRGGQFLNVMSGGRMYQHTSHHTQDHLIKDLETGEEVLVSSTHHQMMMPSPRGILVASSTLGGTREWFDKDILKKDVSKEDIEVVYYPHTQCLCFQPHPEFMGGKYKGMYDYFESLLMRYIVKEYHD